MYLHYLSEADFECILMYESEFFGQPVLTQYAKVYTSIQWLLQTYKTN